MSSVMFDIPIVFNNQETGNHKTINYHFIILTNVFPGKIHHERYSISRQGKVREIMEDLNQKFPGSSVYLNNALSQLQEDDIIEDVFSEEDVLTAVKQRHDMRRNGGKWVDNRSGDIVVLMGKSGKPSYVEPSNEQFWEFSFLEFYPKLVVFR